VESVVSDGSPTLSGEVSIEISIRVAFISKSSPFTESGHSVLIVEAVLAELVATLVVTTEFVESIVLDGSPTLSGEVVIELRVVVTLVSKSSPFTESGHSVLIIEAVLAELVTTVVVVVTEFVESVVLGGSPTLSGEVAIKLRVSVTFSSESFPFSESEESVLQ